MGLIIKGTIPRVPPFSLWEKCLVLTLAGRLASCPCQQLVFGEGRQLWPTQMECAIGVEKGRFSQCHPPSSKKWALFWRVGIGCATPEVSPSYSFYHLQDTLLQWPDDRTIGGIWAWGNLLDVGPLQLQDVAFKPPTGVTPGRPFRHGLTYNDAAGQIEMTQGKTLGLTWREALATSSFMWGCGTVIHPFQMAGRSWWQ